MLSVGCDLSVFKLSGLVGWPCTEGNKSTVY